MPTYAYINTGYFIEKLPLERTEWTKLFSSKERQQHGVELTEQALSMCNLPKRVIEQMIGAIMFCEINVDGFSIRQVDWRKDASVFVYGKKKTKFYFFS